VTHINPRLSAEHLAFIINDAADEILFFDYTFLPLICALRPLPTVKHFVLLRRGMTKRSPRWMRCCF
jgi:fatty-acyl-CoA synthase